MDNTTVSLFIGSINKSIIVLSEYSLPKIQDVINPKMSKPPTEITCDKDIKYDDQSVILIISIFAEIKPRFLKYSGYFIIAVNSPTIKGTKHIEQIVITESFDFINFLHSIRIQALNLFILHSSYTSLL